MEEAAMKRILAMHPAAVVLANRRPQTFTPSFQGPNGPWREASRKTLETLDSAGIATILLRDTPTPGIDIPDCLSGDTSWWSRHHATNKNPCMLNCASALNEGVFRAEQQAASGLTHVRILDLTRHVLHRQRMSSRQEWGDGLQRRQSHQRGLLTHLDLGPERPLGAPHPQSLIAIHLPSM